VRPVAAALVVSVTVAAVVLLLAACGGPSSGASIAEQVQSWVRTTGLDASLRTLEADGQRARVVAANTDAVGLRTVCDVLVTDALGANQNLPSPDASLTSILTAAYRAAAAAGQGCVHGSGSQHGLPERVNGELAAARAGYVKAQARVDLVELPGGAAS